MEDTKIKDKDISNSNETDNMDHNTPSIPKKPYLAFQGKTTKAIFIIPLGQDESSDSQKIPDTALALLAERNVHRQSLRTAQSKVPFNNIHANNIIRDPAPIFGVVPSSSFFK